MSTSGVLSNVTLRPVSFPGREFLEVLAVLFLVRCCPDLTDHDQTA